MIQGMIRKKSYVEIASIMERPEALIKEYILRFTEDKNIITRQNTLDQKIKNRSNSKAQTDRSMAIKLEMKKIKAARDIKNYERPKKIIEPLFITRHVDNAKMIWVRVDSKTVLQVPLGSDVDKIKENYKLRTKPVKPVTPAYKVIKKFRPIII